MVRNGDPSWGGCREGGEVSKQQESLSLAGLWEFGNLREQHNQERGKKKHIEYALTLGTPLLPRGRGERRRVLRPARIGFHHRRGDERLGRRKPLI